MRPSTFFYIIGQGVKGVFRNRVMTVASILVLIACMVLVGTLYLVIDTIESNFKDIEDIRVIEVRIDKYYTEDQILQIADQFAEICDSSEVVDWNSGMWKSDILIPRDENFKFISADEHLKNMFNTEEYKWLTNVFKPEDIQSFNENYDPLGIESVMMDNPLRPSFRITFKSFSDMDAVRSLVARIDAVSISDENGVELPDTIPTDDIKNNVSIYLNVMSIKNVLSVASIWLMAIFLIISLFVIMNTIKLGVAARENEIKFMRLCGATKRFVRMPFMIEGIIIGIFAAIFAFGIEFYLYEYLLKGIISSATGTGGIEGIKTASFIYDYGFKLGIGFTVIGLFAGVVASGISMKKFLKT